MSTARGAAILTGIKWGNLLEMPEEQRALFYHALSMQFPDMGPVELSAGFCLLGGNTIYDKGEFWLNRMAKEETCVGKPQCWPIFPDSPLWERYMRDQDPAAIAAASVCRIERLHPVTGEIREYEGANYVSKDDAMLYGQAYVTVLDAKSKAEALKKAEAGDYYYGQLLPESAKPDGWARQDHGEWAVRMAFRYPDYVALARLAADTRAARRVGKRAFPLVSAKLELALEAVRALQEQTAEIEDVEQQRRFARREAEAEDPYASAEEIESQVDATAPQAVVSRPINVDDRPIESVNVRNVYSLLTERVGAAEAHESFKRMIADARGLDASDDKVLEGCNPHEITVGEWRTVMEMIDRIPIRDQEPTEEVEAVEEQEDLGL